MVNKKGTLALSIRAIVIIVLAMTILGLGLGFVKGLFGKITEIGVGVTEEIRTKILDDLRAGNKRLSFPTPEVSIERGTSKTLAIGVMNNAAYPLSFTLEIAESQNPDELTNEFLYTIETEELGIGQVNVFPIRLEADSAKRGTALYKIKIIDQSEDHVGEEYASKTFFVTVI